MAESDAAPYFYADGDRVELRPDSAYVLLDLAQVRPAHQRRLRKLLSGLSPLRDDAYVVERQNLPQSATAALERDGALQPVFRHGATVIVALPEVRVEVSGDEQRKLLEDFLDEERGAVMTAQQRGNRWLLRPISGRGLDALDLANRLHEKIHPDLVQARLVRMIPKEFSRPRQ